MADMAAVLAADTGLSEADAQKLLDAQARRNAGSAPHTVQMEPLTDKTAVRTVRGGVGGVPGWWVIDHSDGSCTFEMTPDKGWPELFTPVTP